eukprot:TRINITY_DN1485_c1_g3_i1.p1 TRINITY_DN1485_c1_g3~~TRINITY_DN1485_c1_g3_i1.p1  ORF type:complete len:112 (-),score=19.07 TRINITY_DN1485_c1_g3_i1:215-550(-)
MKAKRLRDVLSLDLAIKVTTVGLVGLGLSSFFYPMILAKTGGSRIDLSKPIQAQHKIRGAFNNSGSRDMGPDPDSPINKPFNLPKQSLEDLHEAVGRAAKEQEEQRRQQRR